MSTVFYRWGAGRDESRVKFDGTHISVFDFKRQVMLDNNLGNGKDFDIVVFDNGEEQKDDDLQIARSSSLIVRRRPAVMKGRGTAQNYIVGTDAAGALTGDHRIEAHAREEMKNRMLNRNTRGTVGTFGSMSKRFDGKDEKQPALITTGDADEDAKIQAMLQQNADTWEEMQEDMSTLPRFNAGMSRRPVKPAGPGGSSKFDFSIAPDKDPPVGYICYRCGQKGHWIQNCPTNDDPAAQDRKRFVRVTGIPRSFLKTVETPTTGEGSSGGAMLTADGGFVRAVPDQRAWQKQAAVKPRALTGADVREQEPIDQELTCSICKKLIWDAVRVPCCETAYCEECIQTYLLEHGFECPTCESKVASLDKLVADEDLRARVKSYVDGEIERSKKEGREEETETDNKNDVNAVDGAHSDNAAVAGQSPFNGPMPDMNTLQAYLQAMMQTLRNPLMPPFIKAQLQAHIKMTNANLLQMQMLTAQGMILGSAIGSGMTSNLGMDIVPNQMTMGLPTGMGGRFMPGLPMGSNSGAGLGGSGSGMGFGGRVGFRGSFRGRGGFATRGFLRPSAAMKRSAEEEAGGVEKMTKTA